MLGLSAHSIDTAQRLRGDVALVAVPARDHRNVFDHQQRLSAAEGLGDGLDLGWLAANGAGRFGHRSVGHCCDHGLGSRLGRRLAQALGQRGSGLGQVRGAQLGEQRDGAFGVAAALGAAALAGEGFG